MTEREKLLETLKVAYDSRKIPQDDGSVALFYPTDEDVADMIEAAIIDEYKHRAKVAERALQKFAEYITCKDCPFFLDCASSEKMGYPIHSNHCFSEYLKQAEREIEE